MTELHRIGIDLDEHWLVIAVALGLRALEDYLTNYAAFELWLESH